MLITDVRMSISDISDISGFRSPAPLRGSIENGCARFVSPPLSMRRCLGYEDRVDVAVGAVDAVRENRE
jgi:hypothetical protein